MRWRILLCSFILLFNLCVPGYYCYAEEKSTDAVSVDAKSYVLMEGSTGRIICERKKDQELMPASKTKIMTMLLIFEALDEGKISMEDTVTVSEHAASMGGSQVYLEAGETQSVKDMIKCIAMASANDACVAMAEYLCGSEEAFVEKMNVRAKELGMEHSHFSNCCGLDNDLQEKDHYSTAYDIALMSRELICKHEQVKEFTTVWMDQIVHVTKKGESEFGLTNTNKLVRTYDGITGLKTGSTSKAKFCLSATASRDGMDLIAVVMAAPTPKERFSDAATLLDYGFANCRVYKDDNAALKGQFIEVKKGKKAMVKIGTDQDFSYVCIGNEKTENIEKKMVWNDPFVAPIKKGTAVGKVIYFYNGEKIGSVNVLAEESVDKAKYTDYFKQAIQKFLLIY